MENNIQTYLCGTQDPVSMGCPLLLPSSWTIMLQTHWTPFCSLNTLSCSLLQAGLCTLPWTEYLCPSLPKFIYWNLIPNVMVFGGGTFGQWLSHEVGALMNRISALIRVIREFASPLCCCVGHSVKAVYEPESGSSPDAESTSTLILDFLVSSTIRNKFLLFKPRRLWCFSYSSQNGLKHTWCSLSLLMVLFSQFSISSSFSYFRFQFKCHLREAFPDYSVWSNSY